MEGPKIGCLHNVILVTADMAEVLSTGSLYMVSTCHTLYGQEDSVQSGEVRYDSYDKAGLTWPQSTYSSWLPSCCFL